jgi:hypothetical protein
MSMARGSGEPVSPPRIYGYLRKCCDKTVTHPRRLTISTFGDDLGNSTLTVLNWRFLHRRHNGCLH